MGIDHYFVPRSLCAKSAVLDDKRSAIFVSSTADIIRERCFKYYKFKLISNFLSLDIILDLPCGGNLVFYKLVLHDHTSRKCSFPTAV